MPKRDHRTHLRPPFLQFSAMLDYSDDEPLPHRRRNHSPTAFGPRLFLRRPPPPPDPFPAPSIIRELKEKSRRLMMAGGDRGLEGTFVIGDFGQGRALKGSEDLERFHEDWKAGTTSALEDFPLHLQDHPDSFYKSMATLVLLAQFFAVLPVSGFRGTNYNSISFSWIHYKTFFWAVTFFGTLFSFVCVAIAGLNNGVFDAASGIVYFSCGVLSSLLMLSLSRNWKDLNREFARVELRLKKYGYPKKIGFKFKIVTIVVLLVALVEHILAKLRNLQVVMKCTQHKTDFFDMAESFFQKEYIEIFSLFHYSFWKSVLVFISHFLTTANWNFKDLFLAMISWTIAERFNQLHDLLDRAHGQDKPVSFWKEVREDYNSLSVLTKRVDAFIRKLMFLSMGNNIFFICMQLFHSLKKKVDSLRLVYFFWSFGFLVLRTGFVAFSAARINDESKEPKTILYSVPQKNYTAEVRRFLTQLTTNEVALTGSGFFSITRSLILTITGSVITYEIVLVQFQGPDMEDFEGNRTICY